MGRRRLCYCTDFVVPPVRRSYAAPRFADVGHHTVTNRPARVSLSPPSPCAARAVRALGPGAGSGSGAWACRRTRRPGSVPAAGRAGAGAGR